MPRRSLPPLSPDQVIALFDALLTNADALLRSADVILQDGQVQLARSLAILGLEESGKAIALHDRRVAMAYRPEGESFVDEQLAQLWLSHRKKLETVHRFLLEERYWFGTGPTEPTPDLVMSTIVDWADEKNDHKQQGFYVDVDLGTGVARGPQDPVDPVAVADVLDRVHQIGWQLRLGQHIEASRQDGEAKGVEPASEDMLADWTKSLHDGGVEPEHLSLIIDGMREGVPGRALNNDGYRYVLPGPDASAFENVGKPGYEAQDRELRRLWREVAPTKESEPPLG